LSWAKRLFSGKLGEKNEIIQLRDLGLKVYADRHLEERIKLIELLHLAIEGAQLLPDEEETPETQVIEEIGELIQSNDPEEKIDGLRMKLNLLDRVLRTSAIPWLRPGDGTATARILQGWERLYSKAKDIINSVDNIIRRGEEGGIIQRLVNKSELVENLEGFLNVEVFSYGLLIADMSFMDRDVRPSQAAVIYQPFMGPGNPQPIPQGYPPGWAFKPAEEVKK